MKYLSAALILLFWFLATIILTLSFIGLIAMIDDDSTWFTIPTKCLKVFES